MIISMIEGLIDFVPDKNGSYTPITGGSTFNSSIALGRLGAKVGFCGNLSNDFFGDLQIKKLKTNNVSTKYINRVDKPTTLAFVSYDENKQPSYAFYSENTADISFNSVLPEFPSDVNCLLFGSYSIALEPSGSTIEKIINEKINNYIIALDPNIRMNIAKDKKLYLERIKRLINKANIIKLSTEDFISLYGKNYTIDDMLNYLKEISSSEIIFVTDGEKGSHAITRKNLKVHVSALKLSNDEIVDTVGAGDSFFSALLVKLEELGYLKRNMIQTIDENKLTQIMNFATIVSGINCTRKGANSPTLEEVNNYIK